MKTLHLLLNLCRENQTMLPCVRPYLQLKDKISPIWVHVLQAPAGERHPSDVMAKPALLCRSRTPGANDSTYRLYRTRPHSAIVNRYREPIPNVRTNRLGDEI